MERNVILAVVLALVGAAMGVTVGVLWLPPPVHVNANAIAIERPPPVIEFVAPGRRAIVLAADGTPAAFVDVFLTDISTEQLRYSIRTNFAGHLALPVGRFRVQAFSRHVEGIDAWITVPEGDHPDVELRLEKVQLFRLLGAR